MPRPGFKVPDLLPVIYELVDAAHEIDSRDKDKVCKFVANLVANGGNKTRAARAAGYGEAKDKDGKKRSEESRDSIAAAKAQFLIKNDTIKNLYDKFYQQKFFSTILRKFLTKEHVLYLNYAMFEMYYEDEKRANLAMAALQEIAKLEGFYAPEKEFDEDKAKAMIEELIAAKSVVSAACKDHFADVKKIVATEDDNESSPS